MTQHRELKDHSWLDLQVASWPLREIDLKDAKQTDGYAFDNLLTIFFLFIESVCDVVL